MKQALTPFRSMSLIPYNLVFLLALNICWWASRPVMAADSPCASATLDRLPVLPRNVCVHQISSHNKKGLNGDAGWFLYKDEHGDSVVFDASGPGCLRSFWETAIPDGQVLKFYFDCETRPRLAIPAVDLFQGKHAIFPAPLASYEKMGYWSRAPIAGNCFVPIPFAKSLKISVQESMVAFHHFIYERYPHGTPVVTFTGTEDREYLLQAFARQGEELQPPTGAETIRAATDTLKSRNVMDLLNIRRPGTVTQITIEGPATDEFLQHTDIEMQWDESLRPDVLGPVGMFFGAGSQPTNVRALPVKVERLANDRVRLTSHFRMPFWRKGRISLVTRSSLPAGKIVAVVQVTPQRWAEEEAGHFHALYRDGRTDMGRDWLFCDALGTGWFVGVVQTMSGSHYCEGNEHFTLDGAGAPQIIGTGTEDYYLACFWPNPLINKPFAGCTYDIVDAVRNAESTEFKFKPYPACYYRFHLDAPIPFYRSLDASIQHGGRSDIVSQYRSLAFYYLRKRPVLRQTDLLDVANPTSEQAHNYCAPDSKLTEELEAAYEGNADETLVRDRGRHHAGGEITFTVAVDPNNDGVRLRRRLDQNCPRQAADVYVDGHPAGEWYDPDRNPFIRWFDSEFDLPGDLTRGKSALKIRLVVKKEGGYGDFTDYRYEFFVFEKRPAR
jgi:hypothetical protein